MVSLTDRLEIVLVQPRTPENVGSIARAMANFGLRRLTIAGSSGICADPRARRLAVHCEDLLEGAREIPDWEAVRQEASLVLGTTAHRDYEGWNLLDPKAAFALARQAAGPVALVLGSERYGLSKADLRRCDQVLHVPTAVSGQSLNLAQAVLVLVWELWRSEQELAVLAALPAGDPADRQAEPLHGLDAGNLDAGWMDLLQASGFLKPHNREKKLATLRRVLSRVRLTPTEAASLVGLGSKLALLCEERRARRQGRLDPADTPP